MAFKTGMFIFDVEVESVKSFVESRHCIVRIDFADVLSLQLSPKQMIIIQKVLQCEPHDKNGKIKPTPKQREKNEEEKVNCDPCLQSGQSVLFTSKPEILIQAMRRFPIEVAVWSRGEILSFVGRTSVPWDELFFTYLEKIYQCETPEPVSYVDEYNILEEVTAQEIAKVRIQIRLTYLTDRVVRSFQTSSEDPTEKKFLNIDRKIPKRKTTLGETTDNITKETLRTPCFCSIEPGDEHFVRDKGASELKSMILADYKNAPGANLFLNSNDGDFCCLDRSVRQLNATSGQTPNVTETCSDLDYIMEHLKKVKKSCNDNLKWLTERPCIQPSQATYIDRLCYSRETQPNSERAQICTNAFKPESAERPKFGTANIRGPCGTPHCKVARALKFYMDNLVIEDNEEFHLNELIQPLKSKNCILANKIHNFVNREGEFKAGLHQKGQGLFTQCACLKPDALTICDKNYQNWDTYKTENCYLKDQPTLEPIVHVAAKNAPTSHSSLFYIDCDYCCVDHDDRPLYINSFNLKETESRKIETANIRGPCGASECKVAKNMRAHIEKLVIEDNEEFDLNDLIGPCGSKDCFLVQNILELLKREGDFKSGSHLEGLSTQCGCVKQMQKKVKAHSCNSMDRRNNFKYIKENFCTKDKTALKFNVTADLTNASGTNLSLNSIKNCCMCQADNPLNNVVEVCPDIDSIVDYVRKVLRSCNNEMRRLTPRPAIRPKVRASDIDRFCYCKKSIEPARFKKHKDSRPDCKLGRDLVAGCIEENEEFDLNDLVGPCGSKDCKFAYKIHDFIKREGGFKARSHPGADPLCQCTRLKQLQDEFAKKEKRYDSICNKKCQHRDTKPCAGKSCPCKRNPLQMLS